MKTTPLTRTFVFVLASSVFSLGYAQEKLVGPKPDIKFDGSAIGDGSGRQLVSYADVIEPVQKAVVSV